MRSEYDVDARDEGVWELISFKIEGGPGVTRIFGRIEEEGNEGGGESEEDIESPERNQIWARRASNVV
jgi:hypothetical protein